MKASSTTGESLPEIDNPCKPVFKPMLPLNPKDFVLFLGRKKELEDLYQMTFNTNLLLVYGPSGSGKSSLVRCGLPNKFASTKWQGIIVERRENINQSLRRTLEREWEKAALDQPEVPSAEPLELLHKIQNTTFKPIYIVFDHLEALFNKSANPGEQQQFFSFLQELTRSEGTIKAILIINEAQLAMLSPFEMVVPNLFEHRYRLEGMSKSDMVFELGNMLGQLSGQVDLKVDNPEMVSQSIVQKLGEGKDNAEMACMQVYLHQLQQEACRRKNGGPAMIDPKLIESAPPPKQMIEAYLEEQRSLVEARRELPGENIDQLQKQLDELNSIQSRCQGTPPAVAAAGAAAAPPGWTSWLGWLLFLLFLLALLLFLFFRKDLLANTTGPASCAEYVAYLQEFGTDAPLSAQYQQQLLESECLEQQDCWRAIQANNCDAYINYLQTYGPNGQCAGDFINNILKQCVFSNGTPIQDCSLLSTVLPGTIGDEVLCLIYSSYLDTYGTQDSCAQVLRNQLARLDCGNVPMAPENYEDLTASCAAIRAKLESNVSLSPQEKSLLETCDCNQARADNNCRAYETYLKQYGDDGICSAEFRQELQQCGECEAVRKKNTCGAYEDYLKKYGNDGYCSREFRAKLTELRAIDCPLPISRVAYLKACPTPVSWVEAQTSCGEGWKLVCSNQIRFLLDNYYGNDLKSTYSNWFNAGSASLTYSPVGFWTATESTDNSAYAVETTNGMVRILANQSKEQKRPCLCIKEAEEYKKSGLSKLECLSKSLN